MTPHAVWNGRWHAWRRDYQPPSALPLAGVGYTGDNTSNARYRQAPEDYPGWVLVMGLQVLLDAGASLSNDWGSRM